MFGLMMSEDRISLQKRRQEIIRGLRALPGESIMFESIEPLWVIPFLFSYVKDAVNYSLLPDLSTQ